jgi:hypothetical protein
VPGITGTGTADSGTFHTVFETPGRSVTGRVYGFVTFVINAAVIAAAFMDVHFILPGVVPEMPGPFH